MARRTKLVRLKPYSIKRRHKLRRLTFLGYKFIGTERGNDPHWYKVPEDVARDLEKITQDPNDPDTPFAFDVVATDEDRKKLEHQDEEIRAREVEQAQGRGKSRSLRSVDRGDLSSRDLSSSGGRKSSRG